MKTDEQQAKLAELAQQIAEVQARPAGVDEKDTAGTSTSDRRSRARSRNGARSADTGGTQPEGSTGGVEPGDQRTRAQHEAAARAICLRLLAIAPRPRAGLAQALDRKEIPSDVATAVLDWFAEIGLIDDAAYARSFVRVKHRDRALGRAKLRTELRRLGVADEIMSDAVQVVDTEAERVRAAELIDKRIDAAMEAGPVAARRRLLGLLDRRGYPAEVAIPVVESALQDYRGDAEQST